MNKILMYLYVFMAVFLMVARCGTAAEETNSVLHRAGAVEAEAKRILVRVGDFRVMALNAVKNAVAVHQETKDAYLAVLKSGSVDDLKESRKQMEAAGEKLENATEVAEEIVQYSVDIQMGLEAVLAELKVISSPEQSAQVAGKFKRIVHLMDSATRTLGKVEKRVEGLKNTWLIPAATNEVPSAAPLGNASGESSGGTP